MPPNFAIKPREFWLTPLIALIATMLFLMPMVLAQTPEPKSLTLQTTAWKKLLDGIEADIKNTPLNDNILSQMTGKLEKNSQQIRKFIDQNQPFAVDAKTLLDKLGKAPKEGEAPESETVTKQRKELQKRFAQTDGTIRSATSLRERSEQIREKSS